MAGGSSIHPTSAVPLSERRGPLTMGLLWVTMVTAFPLLLVGFEWYKEGLTFSQVLLGTTVSCLIILLYSIPATQLGARTGLSYTALSRSIFGRWGSRLVTINLIWMFTLFYGVTALLMADAVNGLFHLNYSLAWMSVGFAIIMSFNNFFGFKGIANFARYVAAPLLIMWVAYTFWKATGSCPPDVLTEAPHKPFTTALTMISTYVIGFAVWGNEKDYWRFSVPKPLQAAVPLAIALLIGQIIFPTTGWMVAKITGITDYTAATSFMNNYSFGGIAWIGIIVLGASYFAANDSGMFGTIQACESLKHLPHRTWVTIIAVISALTAFLLSISGVAKSLDSIVSLNCVIMPTPTVVMLTEWFLLANVFKTSSIENTRVPAFEDLPIVRWPAFSALLSGISVGLLTSGTIPGTGLFHIGVCSVQAWLAAIVVYIPLRIREHKRLIAAQRTILERVLARRFEEASARIPVNAER